MPRTRWPDACIIRIGDHLVRKDGKRNPNDADYYTVVAVEKSPTGPRLLLREKYNTAEDGFLVQVPLEGAGNTYGKKEFWHG